MSIRHDKSASIAEILLRMTLHTMTGFDRQSSLGVQFIAHLNGKDILSTPGTRHANSV
jgi:hypothetical protein